MNIDSPEYEQFLEKRKSWIEDLEGKDPHSVMKQIHKMVWNTAVFRIINEARRLARPAEKGGGVQLNGMIYGFIDESFVNSQLLAVRRLTDPLRPKGKTDVCSITALLADMKKNGELFRRDFMLEADGRRFDYTEGERQLCEWNIGHAGRGATESPGSLDLRLDRMWNKNIDRLARVSASHRSLEDRVHPEIFAFLLCRVEDACADIRLHVNKFIAHAATRESRADEKANEINLTFEDLWNAHQCICQVANFTSKYLLSGTGHSFLPIPQFDQFKYIDHPLVSHDNVSVLHDTWQGFDAVTSEWASWGVEDLLKEMKKAESGSQEQGSTPENVDQ